MSFGTSPIAAGHDYSTGQPPAPSGRPLIALAACIALTLGVAVGFGIGSAGKEVKTPQSCLTALDLNEQAFGYASDAMGAITSGRFSASDVATDKIKALTPRITQAKADCRAGKN